MMMTTQMNKEEKTKDVKTHRSQHRIIPSILLKDAIPDYDGSFAAREHFLQHQQNKQHHRRLQRRQRNHRRGSIASSGGSSSNSHNNNNHHFVKNDDENDEDGENSSNDDENDDDDESDLDYNFTTQFEDVKRHTADVFNRVRLADRVINRFVAVNKEYVYGQSLVSGPDHANSKKRAQQIENRKKRINNSNNMKTSSQKTSKSTTTLMMNRRGLNFVENDANDDNDRGENNADEHEEEKQFDQDDEDDDDDEVKRLLGDDWKTGDKGSDQESDDENDMDENDDHGEGIKQKKKTTRKLNDIDNNNQSDSWTSHHHHHQQQRSASSLSHGTASSNQHQQHATVNTSIIKRRRLPNLHEVEIDVARKNRRLDLFQVSKAMSHQEDNKKAKAMIQYQGGLLLTQRRRIIEQQNNLQELIEEENGTNYALSGMTASDCLTTVTKMKSKSREILTEEYFSPTRHSMLNIHGGRDHLVMPTRSVVGGADVGGGGGGGGGGHTTMNRSSRQRQQQQYDRAHENNDREENENDEEVEVKHDVIINQHDNSHHRFQSKSSSSASSKIMQQTMDSKFPSNKSNNYILGQTSSSQEEQHRLSRKSEFLKNHNPAFLVEDSYKRIDEFIAADDDDEDFIDNSVRGVLHQKTRSNTTTKMLTPLDFLNSSSQLSLLPSKNANDQQQHNQISKKNHHHHHIHQQQKVHFISHAQILHAIQQAHIDEEHTRHLILRHEQQECRSIVEAYRNFHILSVHPYLEAERFAKLVAAEMQQDIGLLEERLRVGTHVKEVLGNHHDNEERFAPAARMVGAATKNNKKRTVKSCEGETNDEQMNGGENQDTKQQQSSSQQSTNLTSSSSSFVISPQGYSILSSLGEQMDKLRAEVEAEKKNNKSINFGAKEEDDENHHHQSIVFRAKKMIKERNAASAMARRDTLSLLQQETNENDDDELTKAASAMADALQIAQNQQTALALSKIPQLCAFIIDSSSNHGLESDSSSSTKSTSSSFNPSILRYCEYVKQYVENQKRDQKEAAERARERRLADGYYSGKISNLGGDEREEEFVEMKIRNAPAPTIVASKRWAEANQLLYSSSRGRNQNRERRDFAGIPVSNQQIDDQENQQHQSKGKQDATKVENNRNKNDIVAAVPLIAGCDLSSDAPCYDIFYPRFVAFEDFDVREARERELMDLQTRVSRVSVVARDSRANAAKARKGVMQCIFQQAELFEYVKM